MKDVGENVNIKDTINDKNKFTNKIGYVAIIFGFIVISFLGLNLYFKFISFHSLFIYFVVSFSIILTFQGIFNLFTMLYAWEDPEEVKKNKAPSKFKKPQYSFTVLIPARHEEKVINDTLLAVSNINYPEELKEILIICRADDDGTILKVEKTIQKIGKPNIKLLVFFNEPVNKPHGLKIGLSKATNDIVVVFDAEDEPHKEIFNIVNTVMCEGNVDVVQSGVQLMNINSNWFSTLNVLEYFFWFKSTLQFMSKFKFVFLGGNTVFFKNDLLKKIDGWDEYCLTEDADIGIRLSAIGARVRVVYDEKYATHEETPSTIRSFIRQRTRWNQGFAQVFLKGDWLRLPKLTQKLLAAYTLLSPLIQSLILLYMPISVMTILELKLPVWLSMFSMIPTYLLVLQMITYNIGLYEFSKYYRIKYSILMPIKIFYTYYPFILMLGISAFRATMRIITNDGAWEKTSHLNSHREISLETART